MQRTSGDEEGKEQKQNSKAGSNRKLMIKQLLNNDKGKKEKKSLFFFLKELEESEFCKDMESDRTARKQKGQICCTLVHGIFPYLYIILAYSLKHLFKILYMWDVTDVY